MISATIQEGSLPDFAGAGGFGSVHRMMDEDHGAVLLKRFDVRVVNLKLLEAMTRRLRNGGWPCGVLPVIRANFGGSAPYLMRPWIDETRGEHEGLFSRWDAPEPDAARIVRSLARALAGMHERGVAHGNLKPGNVFIDESGEVVLADWTLGNMPGIEVFPFTDAVLYQPPEQLRDPSGYSGTAGLRWDVHAFGVLAFRLLAGRFPRCHEVYRRVAPVPGQPRQDDLEVDRRKLAAYLEARGDWTWPEPGLGPDEDVLREWIDRCLSLDASLRPADMSLVAAAISTDDRISAGDGIPRGAMLELGKSSVEETLGRWTYASHALQKLARSAYDDGSLPESHLWAFGDELDEEGPMGSIPTDPEFDDQDQRVSEIAGKEAVTRSAPADERRDGGGVDLPPAMEEPSSWIKAESTSASITDSPARKSKRRRGGVNEAGWDSEPVRWEQRAKLSAFEILGLILLSGMLVASGAAMWDGLILRLPSKPPVWSKPEFPIRGNGITLESAQCYWRGAVTEGADRDVCRVGSLYLPVIELVASGGPSEIRVCFLNEEGATIGDTLVRKVTAGERMIVRGTAGIDDPGVWASYRLGGFEPWTVRIHERARADSGTGEWRQLLELKVPAFRQLHPVAHSPAVQPHGPD